MTTVFRYEPYVWVSEDGVPPGTEHFWTFGPWPWYANAVTITAHPFALAGADAAWRLQVSLQELRLMESGSSTVPFATSVPIGSIMPCGSEGSVHEGVPFKEVATMKILAVHDAQGNISASVVLPTDAPAAAIRVEPGQTITEIDGHNLKFDALKEQSYGRLIELIQNYRIKPITSKAKLIRK